MGAYQAAGDSRVAVLVDCDNVSPEILDYSLRVVAQFGRVVMRRGYGNHGTLGNRWQEALVRQAFTPCLQYQYAAGKNTADIALALDALEVLFDQRADTFCLVTSDSDFAYLCRKLRERGATVFIVGEPKTPDALRNASDQFFEWRRRALESENEPDEKSGSKVELDVKTEGVKPVPPRPPVKRRPRFVVEAVALLTSDTSEGKVSLGALGQYLKRTDPAFSPQTYGHTGLLDMLKTYDLLTPIQESGGHWSVSLASRTELDVESSSCEAGEENSCPHCGSLSLLEHLGVGWCARCKKFSRPPDPALLPSNQLRRR